MAIQPVTSNADGDPFSRQKIVKWSNLANGDTGAPVRLDGYHLDCYQIIGTTGAGMQTAIQATLDPQDITNFADVLTQNNNLGIATTTSSVFYGTNFRPIVKNGDGTTLLTFIAIFIRGD